MKGGGKKARSSVGDTERKWPETASFNSLLSFQKSSVSRKSRSKCDKPGFLMTYGGFEGQKHNNCVVILSATIITGWVLEIY